MSQFQDNSFDTIPEPISSGRRRVTFPQLTVTTARQQVMWLAGISDKGFYRIMVEQDFITFKRADEILTRLGRVDLWYTDPVLNEYYERLGG